MPQITGTVSDYLFDLGKRLTHYDPDYTGRLVARDRALPAVPFDVIAPLAVYLYADVSRKAPAEAAFAKLKSRRHPLLAIAEREHDDFPIIPRDISFADVTHLDKGDVILLYEHALCTEIGKHLNPNMWDVEIGTYGEYNVVLDGVYAFVGDSNTCFEWVTCAAAVKEQCLKAQKAWEAEKERRALASVEEEDFEEDGGQMFYQDLDGDDHSPSP